MALPPMPPIPEGAPSVEAWQAAIAFGRLEGLQRVCQHNARLGAADRRLMWLLPTGTAMTLRGIAEALGLEQSTVNRQVNAALAAGLLERVREPGRTAHMIVSTDDGQHRFRHDLDLTLGAYQAALDALSADERRTFIGLLLRFVEAYDEGLTHEA